MILPELEKLIRQIEFRKSKRMKTSRSGSVLSPRAGRGLDFKEVREYNYGDDTRHVDWNVSSRMGDLYVKEFHQENDRIIYLFLDQSASMFTGGTGEYSKYFIAFQFMAFGALLFLHGGDRIHLVSYSDKIDFASDAIKTKTDAYRILRKFYEKTSTSKSTDHLLPFWYLKNRVSRNAIAYIISDFASLPNLDSYRPLLQLHEVHGIRVFDTTEVLDSDIFRYFFIHNPESKVGGQYQSQFFSDEKIAKEFFRSRLLNLRTDADLGSEIMRFLLK
jgi:uncharacterized protein (DUF58 family)